jgi:hypothetical protein
VLHPRARRTASGPADTAQPHPRRRDSFRWPARAASAPSTPVIHRALRLVIAAGTAAAGICLVLALTVLVVQLGATGVARTASNRPVATSQSGDTSASLGGRWVAGPAIASFHGTGPARHHHFAVSSPGIWGLSWSFSCSTRRPGHFQLTVKGTTTGDDVEVEVASPAGRGITWNTGAAGAHSLDVSSDCSWTARVVLAEDP